MTDNIRKAQRNLRGLSQALEGLSAEIEDRNRALMALSKRWDLTDFDADAFDAFMGKPYLLRPLRDDRFELILPKFVDFRAGWPVRTEGEYKVFMVSRMVDLITPLPDWLRDEMDLPAPDFAAHMEGDWLVVDEGDPGEVWERLGRGKSFSKREGKRMRMMSSQRLKIVRDLLRKGILPYTPMPIPGDVLREPQGSVQLREKQARDFETFMLYSSISVFATGGAGKTYFGMYALDRIEGAKAVVAPRRAILDQWKARMQKNIPHAADEVEFLTYQAIQRKRLRDVRKMQYNLVIYDEIQHMPAAMGMRAAEMNTKARIGLSATPWREDGNEDLIPALCGIPAGADWPSGEPAKTIVWLVNGRQREKIALVEQLISKPTRAKTMIFVYRLDVGHALSKALGLPFIHGGTRKQFEAIRKADTFIISKVGDAGISIDASRVIEVDWLGGRAEAGQRALRTQHADERGELHILMTQSEYNRGQKRLAALYALDFDVKVMGA